MTISSRIRRIKLSCPESGGGFKANVPAPRFAALRRNETKPDEMEAQPAISFHGGAFRICRFGEAGDFADPCRFNVLGGVLFRPALRAARPPCGGRVSLGRYGLSQGFRALPSNCPPRRLESGILARRSRSVATSPRAGESIPARLIRAEARSSVYLGRRRCYPTPQAAAAAARLERS
jgi:hypothetical protein